MVSCPLQVLFAQKEQEADQDREYVCLYHKCGIISSHVSISAMYCEMYG